MIFLTKRVSVGDVVTTARELAPLLAFCELLEDPPTPAVLLNGSIVCLRSTVEAVDLLFDHPNLGVGVETATNEDLQGSSILSLPKNNALPALIQALTPSALRGRVEKTFAGALDEEVRRIIRMQSAKVGFMLLEHPYREPGLVLRTWSLNPPENCRCLRLKCESCLVARWAKTSTMKKASISVPPVLTVQPNCFYARPPAGARFAAGINPFGWSVNGVMLKNSIW